MKLQVPVIETDIRSAVAQTQAVAEVGTVAAEEIERR